ncbi:hypothetical protein ACLMJK_004953 [Lecanora helva]
MSSLPTISLASIAVGFISFAFTFFTFLRVFWETILTLWSAPKQAKAYLDNLRSEILNERAYFKSALRRTKSRSRSIRRYHEDVVPLRVLNSTVKRIHRQFNTLESPFLAETPDKIEKDIERSDVSDEPQYAPMTFSRRWRWMRSKEDIISMADQVNRIQTQRIACDASNILMKLHTIDKTVQDFEDRLWDLEEHLMGERLEDGKIYVKRRVDRNV